MHSRYPSPLRYPGGKTQFYPTVSNFLARNNLLQCSYSEPYAGGAGLALSLLLNGIVKEIHLNDVDLSIWSFWHSILNHTKDFINKIERTSVSASEWHRQKHIQALGERADTLSLGFSTLFLNRTNRSGIIHKAGMIGGKNQCGQYKLDCRFNKKSIIEKILNIAENKQNIMLYRSDAIDFLEKIDDLNGFVYLDPPYYEKGKELYLNFYNDADHRNVFAAIQKLQSSWLLSYDNVSYIKNLYADASIEQLNIRYSAGKRKQGSELLICRPTRLS